MPNKCQGELKGGDSRAEITEILSLRSFSPSSPQPRPAPPCPRPVRPGSSQPCPAPPRPCPILSGNNLSCLLSAGPPGRAAVPRRTTSHGGREEPRAEDGSYWGLSTVRSVTDRCADEGQSHFCDLQLKVAGLGIQATGTHRSRSWEGPAKGSSGRVMSGQLCLSSLACPQLPHSQQQPPGFPLRQADPGINGQTGRAGR